MPSRSGHELIKAGNPGREFHRGIHHRLLLVRKRKSKAPDRIRTLETNKRGGVADSLTAQSGHSVSRAGTGIHHGEAHSNLSCSAGQSLRFTPRAEPGQWRMHDARLRATRLAEGEGHVTQGQQRFLRGRLCRRSSIMIARAGR